MHIYTCARSPSGLHLFLSLYTEKSDKEESFVAHVPVPTTEAIEKAVLEQKKKEMMARYVRVGVCVHSRGSENNLHV
jgi:hypothetical protein